MGDDAPDGGGGASATKSEAAAAATTATTTATTTTTTPTPTPPATGGSEATQEGGRRPDSTRSQDLSFLQKGGFEIVRITERHSRFRKAVPTMPLQLAIFCLVLNIFLPGTGTLVSAFTVFKYPTEYEQKSKAFCNNLLAAFLQVLTLVVIVGYIWSVYWGVTFVSLAINQKATDEKEANIPEPTKV